MEGRRQLEQLTSSVPAIYELSLEPTNVRYGGVAAAPHSHPRDLPRRPVPPPPRGVFFDGGGSSITLVVVGCLAR
jgi:hypothetical protein